VRAGPGSSPVPIPPSCARRAPAAGPLPFASPSAGVGLPATIPPGGSLAWLSPTRVTQHGSGHAHKHSNLPPLTLRRPGLHRRQARSNAEPGRAIENSGTPGLVKARPSGNCELGWRAVPSQASSAAARPSFCFEAAGAGCASTQSPEVALLPASAQLPALLPINSHRAGGQAPARPSQMPSLHHARQVDATFLPEPLQNGLARWPFFRAWRLRLDRCQHPAAERPVTDRGVALLEKKKKPPRGVFEMGDA